MKLYWGDYHKATRHLRRDQHGAYFLLIGEAWRLGGSLPDDDNLLAAWALCTPDEWAAMKSVIMSFFALRRGSWVHDRVREELASYEATSRKRKEAGRKGGKASVGKDLENPEAIAPQKPTKPEPEPEPKKEPKGSSSPSLFAKAWAAYPEGGRRRSSKGKAAEVWAKIADEAGGEGALLSAVQAYARTPDATRDAGQYAPAFERWLRDGKWEHYRGDLFSGEIGETDALPERVQRSWAEDWRDKGPNGWKRWERGPYPGEPGCRVSPAIITEITRERISA
jgi:uncharacterized protein YdaU (DUF1376 family)